jgi:glycine oxidase
VGRLHFSFEFQRDLGKELAWLSGPTRAGRAAPQARITAAAFSPHDHQVDNRRLPLAQNAAFLKSGGELREHTEVSGVCTGVGVNRDRHSADAVVLAAVAWSALLEGLPDMARLPVRRSRSDAFGTDGP